MRVMCLTVNPVKLLVKVHLVLPFASVSSKVYSDINKINYCPFKRTDVTRMVFGKRCHEHISQILRKLQKAGLRENHV